MIEGSPEPTFAQPPSAQMTMTVHVSAPAPIGQAQSGRVIVHHQQKAGRSSKASALAAKAGNQAPASSFPSLNSHPFSAPHGKDASSSFNINNVTINSKHHGDPAQGKSASSLTSPVKPSSNGARGGDAAARRSQSTDGAAATKSQSSVNGGAKKANDQPANGDPKLANSQQQFGPTFVPYGGPAYVFGTAPFDLTRFPAFHPGILPMYAPVKPSLGGFGIFLSFFPLSLGVSKVISFSSSPTRGKQQQHWERGWKCCGKEGQPQRD